MNPAILETGYNERLFSGKGLRNYYHTARYHWLRRSIARDYGAKELTILDIGCFDGKALDYLPANPKRFVGVDAGWENGVEIGRAKYRDRPEVELQVVSDPAFLGQYPDGGFDIGISTETLEHVPDDILEGYLEQAERVIAGNFYITVPNEMGLVFLVKNPVQQLLYKSAWPYTPREFIAAVLHQPQHIERNEHKGFSYRLLIKQLSKRFEIKRVEGIGLPGLPPFLSPTVGIVAAPKSR